MPATRYVGQLKLWTTKGYGFIALGDDEPDVFVHITACDGFKPQAGDRVSFSIVPSDRGDRLKAADVRLAI
jgi:cold shock CspA family protein